MRISRLQAENVHGYLPIDISFFDDLTFLTGLNGSGKTSALKLLMALLTPNLFELASIQYTSATVTIEDGEKAITITSSKTSGTNAVFTLSTSLVQDDFHAYLSEVDIWLVAKRRDDSQSTYPEQFQHQPVIQSICNISTPMFLGLDRRFYAPGARLENLNEVNRREYILSKYWPEEKLSLRNTDFAALREVNSLLISTTQNIRTSQENLDEQLRIEFIKKAFEYKPASLTMSESSLPSPIELQRYREQLKNIERAAEEIAIPVPEIGAAVSSFLERMTSVVEGLNRSIHPKNGPKKNNLRKGSNKFEKDKHQKDQEFDQRRKIVEWMINRPQVDRISEHLRLLDKYISDRNFLRDPIDRFKSLINSFLRQTNKSVSVARDGQLVIKVEGSDIEREINALSSGERQLLVMLANLSLNPNLSGSGVFIVDEPELSLHIDWQEKFVDAVRRANPNVQLILATHSPAIILDRVDACISMSGQRND